MRFKSCARISPSAETEMCFPGIINLLKFQAPVAAGFLEGGF
jgi:hypothetical protein